MPSTLQPSTGLTLPSWGASTGNSLPWPYGATALRWPIYGNALFQDQPRTPTPSAARVLPSFSTSGMPAPITASPAAAANPFAPALPTAATTTTTAGAPIAGQASGTNPFFTLSNVKSPALDTTINALLGDFNALRTNGMGDFSSKLKAAEPQFAGILQQDLGAAGDYFNGVIPGQLEALRASRKAASRAAADRALGDLTRILNLGRMGQGGGATAGPSSYISKLGLDKAAEIETATALDDAAQARADFDAVQAARMGLLGKRGDLLQSDVNRSLLPEQAQAQWFNQLLTNFLPLIQANLNNRFYGLGAPRAGEVVGLPNYQPMQPLI